MAPRRKPELLTTAQVAELLGLGGRHERSARSSALRQLKRWGVEPYDRQPGRAGQTRFRADHVRAAIELHREPPKEST